jgi:catechol 2,3-dioxygenase-like lactoylglutathione lyase family enzyme
MVSGLHHAGITTGDLDRLIRFYRDLLGFELVLEMEWGAGNATADATFALDGSAVRMAMLRTANAFLELFEFASPIGRQGDPERPVCDRGIAHICLEVADVDAEYCRLTAAGMRFHCAPQTVPGLCRLTYGRDPDGNIVELLEAEPSGLFAR